MTKSIVGNMKIRPESGGAQVLSARHEVGGGVFGVTRKIVSFTIVLLGGHLQDLTN